MYTVFLTNICKDDMYKLLFVDQDPLTRKDYVTCCDYAALRQLLMQNQFEFANVKLVDDKVWSATVRDTQVEIREQSVPLQNMWTVFDFIEGMLHDEAFLCEEGMPFSGIGVDFETKSIAADGHILWSPSPLKNNPARDLRICCSVDAFNTMVKPNYADIWDVRVDKDRATFSINLDTYPCTWDNDYCMLRYNVEEFAYLIDKYLHTKSAVRGVQIGSWFKAFLKSDLIGELDLTPVANEGLVWDLHVNLPDYLRITKLLREYGSWLMSKMQLEPSAFREKLGLAGNSYAETFSEWFCKTMLGQHGYFDRQLKRLEIQLLKYQVAMALAPIDIPDVITLCDGYLQVERNG